MPAPDIDALRAASARLGRDPSLIQAAGGNTSLKADGIMTIKASGTWLSDAETAAIFVDIDLDRYLEAVRDGTATDDSAAFVIGGGLRSSIETPVHAVMPHRVVLHVHHVETIALAVCRDGEARLRPRLAGLAWRFVPYVKPGLRLARAMLAAAGGAPVDVYILGNHGLVVGAATVEAAMALVGEVKRRLALPVRVVPEADLARLARLSEGTDYLPAADPAAHRAATDAAVLATATEGTLYPDHVIFLGPGLEVVGKRDTVGAALSRLTEKGRAAPVALAVAGAGVLLRRDAPPAAHALARCLADVATRIPEGADLRVFDATEIDELVNWDAEAYRQTLTRTPP